MVLGILRYCAACFLICANASASAQVEFAPCSLTGSGGNGNLHAECAIWTQPLNREDPTDATLELTVAKLPSTAIDPAKDAFTIINGGPGGSSIDLLVDLSRIIETFTRERDVIVIDQRGTGRSAPLTCEGVTDTTESYDAEATARLTKECLDSLPHDPRYFTTTVAVDDLEALREALGYEQLTVYGVSYGTRVAMQYMRTYPESTRAVIIDGVVPPQRALGPLIAVHSQDVFDAIVGRCQTDLRCNESFPDVANKFARVRDRLSQTSIAMTLQHPVTGADTDLELTYGHLAAWLRFALYSPEMSALVPLIIHEAAENENYIPVAANALRLLHDINASLNYGMHNAVVCTEDTPYLDDAAVDFTQLENTYIGREMYDTLKVLCTSWPEGVRDAALKAPLTSDIPTLVLSGEFDPITPPAWGEEVMPGLSNAKHIVAPGQGHGTIARGCIPRLILDFVETPNPELVDETCLEHLAPYPFFVDLMGPPP